MGLKGVGMWPRRRSGARSASGRVACCGLRLPIAGRVGATLFRGLGDHGGPKRHRLHLFAHRPHPAAEPGRASPTSAEPSTTVTSPLSLEQAPAAQARVTLASRSGSSPGRRVLGPSAAAGAGLLNFIRTQGRDPAFGVTPLARPQETACRRHGLDVHLHDARQVDRDTFRSLRRRRQPRRLRALLLAG